VESEVHEVSRIPVGQEVEPVAERKVVDLLSFHVHVGGVGDTQMLVYDEMLHRVSNMEDDVFGEIEGALWELL
jgi:hypothetical protein